MQQEYTSGYEKRIANWLTIVVVIIKFRKFIETRNVVWRIRNHESQKK